MVVNAKLRAFAVFLSALSVAACQSTLNPVVPAGPQAYDAIAVPPEQNDRAYVLSPGDEVSVTVYGEQELAQPTVQVDATGMLNLTLIGQVTAAGRTISELNSAIESAYRTQYVRDARVTVSLLKATGGTVAVEGEVKNPGIYPIRPGYTLLSAMSLSGSPLPTGRVNHVLIFRKINGQRMGGRFDLKAIRSGQVDDPLIRDGDVVVVGFSRKVGIYQDILKAAPLLNMFVLLDTRTNNGN